MIFVGCVVVAAAFQCIIRALYNLLVVQFAASVSCKLSAKEQKSWLVKGQAASCTKLESLLSRVIGLLTGSSLFDFDVLESPRPAVCPELYLYARLLTLKELSTWSIGWSECCVFCLFYSSTLEKVHLAYECMSHQIGNTDIEL